MDPSAGGGRDKRSAPRGGGAKARALAAFRAGSEGRRLSSRRGPRTRMRRPEGAIYTYRLCIAPI